MVKELLCKVNGGSDGIRDEKSRLFCSWFGRMNVGVSIDYRLLMIDYLRKEGLEESGVK